jgi:hypothetical protein
MKEHCILFRDTQTMKKETLDTIHTKVRSMTTCREGRGRKEYQVRLQRMERGR